MPPPAKDKQNWNYNNFPLLTPFRILTNSRGTNDLGLTNQINGCSYIELFLLLTVHNLIFVNNFIRQIKNLINLR
jgi:hypothetical protein